MTRRRIVIYISIFFVFISNLALSQVKISKDSLYNYTKYLSSHQMMGRFPGSKQDSMSINYIKEKFKNSELVPLFDSSYIHFFTVPMYRTSLSSSKLIIDNFDLEFKKDFFLFPSSPIYSSNKAITISSSDSIISDTNQTNYVKIVNRGLDSIPFIASKFKHMGYKAVIISTDIDQYIKVKDTISAFYNLSIPVYIISNQFLDSTGVNFNDNTKVSFISNTGTIDISTANIIGVTKGDFDNYIVIGAHYDHLGNNNGSIFYGADDNASGVASMIELSRNMLSYDNFGIIFIAFGAEERGLLGSKVIVDLLDKNGILNKIKLMINLDMVGRMRENKIQISGTGSFENADSIIDLVNNIYRFSISKIKDGYGASDHASFYNKNIPVLFLSTGVHSDYHTPRDTYEKINYDGLMNISLFTNDIIKELVNNRFQFNFIKSQRQNMGRSSLNVTLGIAPDFTYDKGDGFKVGPVSKGRPAEKGGILEGDIITRIDEFSINNIYDYMEVLSKLKKGDSVIVHLKREGSLVTLKLEI